ncbi:MAG: DUF6493 family protein [Arcicella sp.]|nr:DUF6493 family protein [Arcicella sp.]
MFSINLAHTPKPMKHYLTFQDDTSDKFWQIETSITSFTVTYGRNGTSGQSQTKTFETEEKCLKEAEKILAEKRKKGYSEEGVASVVASNPKSPKAKTEKEDNLEAVLEEFDQLITSEKMDSLLPFLQKLESRHKEAFRKHIRKAKRYWMTYVELTPADPKKKNDYGKWGLRGNNNQKWIITMSAIAVCDKTDINSWDEAVRYLNISDGNVLTTDILLWAKPNWIGDFLLAKKLKSNWTPINYYSLLRLEELGLITFQPQLYAFSLSDYSNYDYETEVWQSAMEYIDQICSMPSNFQRDVFTLFDYETNLNNLTAFDDKTKQNVPTWSVIFSRLITEGKIDRKLFLENCLQIQTKEWNNGLKAFFRKRFDENDPSKEELIDLQQTILPLLHANTNSVANYAVGIFKDIYQEKGFNTTEFLDWIAPVMMREDCKGSLKLLLTMLEKMLKSNADSKEKIMDLIADVFVVNDLSIQEKAIKIIQSHASKSDEALREKLTMYAPQMLGNGKIALKDFLSEGDSEEIADEGQEYNFKEIQFTFLSEKNRVKLPKTWHEFLFSIGEFIKSGKTIDTEILMNSLITMQAEFPDDFKEQCDPYLKQLQKTYYESVHHNLTKDFLINYLHDNKNSFKADQWYVNSAGKTILVQKERLKYLERKLAKKSVLPMLSMPTHTSNRIAPKTLVERLIAYQENNEPLDMTDFAIAIARMPRERVDEALILCDKLTDKVAKLMRFCLGASDKIELDTHDKSLISRVLFTNSQSIKFSDFNSLWAVAARTHYPDKTFPEFAGSLYDDVPNVIKPFAVMPYIKEYKNEWRHWQTKELGVTYWYNLAIDLPPHKTVQNALLYSLDLFNRNNNYYYHVGKNDIFYWNGFTPQNPQAIFAYILSICLGSSDTPQNALEAGLRLMLANYFKFSETASYVLAVACLVQKKEYRGLAAEVLLAHFEQQTIEPAQLGKKIAYLVQNKYGGIQRFIDVVNLVKDASTLHNQGLLLMIDAMFDTLKDLPEIPMNTKKLLEIYFDLLSKTNKKPSNLALEAAKVWQNNGSLKSISKQILAV